MRVMDMVQVLIVLVHILVHTLVLVDTLVDTLVHMVVTDILMLMEPKELFQLKPQLQVQFFQLVINFQDLTFPNTLLKLQHRLANLK